MSASPMVSNAAVRAGLDAILALLNSGGAGVVKIFTGSEPATCETADTGTLLCTFNLSSTAFASSVDNSAGGATATANAIAAATAGNSGTAGYFRGYPHTPTTTNAVIQGNCGTSAADMVLSSTTITSGDSITISSWTVTLPDGSGTD